jgi:hypothetical protein
MPWHVPQQYDDPGHSRHKVAAGRSMLAIYAGWLVSGSQTRPIASSMSVRLLRM